MKVILRKKTRLGNPGEIKHVRMGYWRNYLQPLGIAVRDNEENRKYFENQAAAIHAEQSARNLATKAIAEKLNNMELIFIQQADESDKLFGSVNTRKIAGAINSLFPDAHATNDCIELNVPIRSLGVYQVQVFLHHDVRCDVIVNVARSEDEAREAARSFYRKLDDASSPAVTSNES